MSSSARSLILGAHTGLPARAVEPFARTLRASGFQGTFVIFAGLCAESEKSALHHLADVVVDVDADYSPPPDALTRLLAKLGSTRRVRRAYPAAFRAVGRLAAPRSRDSLEYHLQGLQTLRYVHYLRFLEGRRPEPDTVMLTDLRDVVFQRDPFADPVDGLELYLEDDSVRIGHDAFNTRWLRNLYGRAELRRLTGKPVSCSGTVVGTRAAVQEYLTAMTAEIARHSRPMGSHDQGVHNALLHRGALPHATVIPNGTGRVLTLGMMPSYRRAPDGTVLNADGTVPAVLHQWDRHAGLADRAYPGENVEVV